MLNDEIVLLHELKNNISDVLLSNRENMELKEKLREKELIISEMQQKMQQLVKDKIYIEKKSEKYEKENKELIMKNNLLQKELNNIKNNLNKNEINSDNVNNDAICNDKISKIQLKHVNKVSDNVISEEQILDYILSHNEYENERYVFKLLRTNHASLTSLKKYTLTVANFIIKRVHYPEHTDEEIETMLLFLRRFIQVIAPQKLEYIFDGFTSERIISVLNSIKEKESAYKNMDDNDEISL